MEIVPKQVLRTAENLSLPTVIVMSANMSCKHCQNRVSQVISKMNGLFEYVVDVTNKQVILKGDFSRKTEKKRYPFRSFFAPICASA